MTHPLRIAPILLACLWITLPAHAQDAAIPADVRDNVRARVAAGENQAIVIGVVDKDGTHYFSHGRVEVGGSEQPDERTLFEIGSITKVFTALLLAEMADAGEVALDDPAAQYLPDSVDVPGGETITLRHLATHTSGLPRLPSNLQPADPANPYADYTVAELYDFLSGYALSREPGAQYEYSNLGVGLLGHALARAAGTSYEALLQERVLGPLGLDDTAIDLAPSQRERLATGHSGSQPVPHWDIPTLAGAGALYSTANDMLRFLAAQIGLADTSLDEAVGRTHTVMAEAGPGAAIALGWHVREPAGARIFWHNGGTGGFRSFAAFDSTQRRGVVVLTNSILGIDDIGLHLLDADVPLKVVQEEVEVAPEVLERYVGAYELAPGFIIEVTRDGDQLYGQATGQARFAMYPSSETTFFLKVADAQIRFDVEEGRVKSLTLFQAGREQAARKIK